MQVVSSLPRDQQLDALRLPPQSIEAEQSVLGGLLLDNTAWDRISDPPSVRALLHAGGVDHVEAVAEAGTHPVPSPEAWWSAVLGSGYRGTLEQLDASARESVRMANLNFIRESGIRSVEANVVYAVATKP